MDVEKDGDRFIFLHEDPKNSHSVTKCLIDNKSTPFIELNDPEANQHARWALITKELEFVESQLTITIERISKIDRIVQLDRRDIESVILKSLVESAIIGYIKCFNQAKGRRVKLELNKLFSTQKGKKYFELHTSIKLLRDSYIAHAGISTNEGSQMIATVDPIPQKGLSKEVVLAHSHFTLLDIDTVDDFLEMVIFVRREHDLELQNKLNTFCQKVIENPVKYKAESIFVKNT
jgi:hypothetical protein